MAMPARKEMPAARKMIAAKNNKGRLPFSDSASYSCILVDVVHLAQHSQVSAFLRTLFVCQHL
jgi:hypothetical protein